MSSKTSAGILLYRVRKNTLEVLLVHMGGPYWQNKDDGWWSIPKGGVARTNPVLEQAQYGAGADKGVDQREESIDKVEVQDIEPPQETAKRECKEELGVEVMGELIPLGEIKQKAGKVVHAWAHEFNNEIKNPPPSNTFEMEWPPKTGRMEQFPEIDQAEFFPIDIARRKINFAQGVFLDRLIEKLGIAPEATITQQRMF